MENRKIPALIALAGIIVAIAVFFAVGDDDTSEQASDTPEPAQTTAADPSGSGEGTGTGPKEPEPKEPAEPEIPEIEIKDGEPVGGVQQIEVTRGDELRINISTDAADELHLHGFEVYLDIVSGKANELVVENADIDGVFELESHSTGAVFAEISVVPD
jgi:hypothetical protein